MKVLVWDRVHVDVMIAPSVCVIVVVPQASVAVALPSAVLIAEAVGLHPSGELL